MFRFAGVRKQDFPWQAFCRSGVVSVSVSCRCRVDGFPAKETLETLEALLSTIEYVAFSEARRQGFSPGTPVSSPPSSVNGFSQ